MHHFASKANATAASARGARRTQKYGIYKAVGAGSVDARNNLMFEHSAQDYHDAALRADAGR
jgi:hypothetical protein